VLELSRFERSTADTILAAVYGDDTCKKRKRPNPASLANPLTAVLQVSEIRRGGRTTLIWSVGVPLRHPLAA